MALPGVFLSKRNVLAAPGLLFAENNERAHNSRGKSYWIWKSSNPQTTLRLLWSKPRQKFKGSFLLVSSKVAKHNELRHLGRGNHDSVVREATESCPQRSQRGKSGARDWIIIKVLHFNFFLFSKPNLHLEF